MGKLSRSRRGRRLSTEGRAAKARGGAHLLIGNYEAMALRGEVHYLNSKYLQTAKILGVASHSELFGRQTMLGHVSAVGRFETQGAQLRAPTNASTTLTESSSWTLPSSRSGSRRL